MVLEQMPPESNIDGHLMELLDLGEIKLNAVQTRSSIGWQCWKVLEVTAMGAATSRRGPLPPLPSRGSAAITPMGYHCKGDSQKL